MKRGIFRRVGWAAVLMICLTFLPGVSPAEEIRLQVAGGERTFYRGGQEYILAECTVEGVSDPALVSWDLLLDAANDPVIALREGDSPFSVTVYLDKDGTPPDVGDYVAMLTCSAGDFSKSLILSASVQDAPNGPLYDLAGIGEEYTLTEGETLTVQPGTDPAGWQIPGEDAVFEVEALTTELGVPCTEAMAEVTEEGGSASILFHRGGMYLVTFGYSCANFHVSRMTAVSVLYEDGSWPISELPDGFHLQETLFYTAVGEAFRITAVPEPDGLYLKDAVIRSEVRFNGKWSVLAENGLTGLFTIDSVGIFPCVYRAVVGTAVYECPFDVVCSPAEGTLSIAELKVTSLYPAAAEPGTKMGLGFRCEGYLVAWTVSAYRDGVLVDSQQGTDSSAYEPLTLTAGEWRFAVRATDGLGHEKTAEALVHVGGPD